MLLEIRVSRTLEGGVGKAHKMSGIEVGGGGGRIGVNYVTGMGGAGFNTGSNIGRWDLVNLLLVGVNT